MVRQATQDVIQRRLRCASPDRVAALTHAAPDQVQQYLEWNRDYAVLALHPPSEATNIDNRVKRFGQGFPGLFNINGDPRPHDVRSGSHVGPSFTGALHVTRPGPILLVPKEPFKIVMRTNCLLRIEPDSSIAISGFVVKNHKLSPKSFKYRINFLYIIAFGNKMSPLGFVSQFERVLVYYFGMNADNAPREEISSGAILEGTGGTRVEGTVR
jgi:hypothetical protein